ncbi:MAG: hypothetical protein PHO66_01660, partial [Eubacteriales bacterium]|nr:hypothetical protein [Eubacteriales bacterium]
MIHTAVFGALDQSGPYQQLTNIIRGGRLPCSAFGLCDGQKAYLLAGLASALRRPLLVITASEIRATRLAGDISSLLGSDVPIFPARPMSLHAVAAASRDFSQRRLSVMANAADGALPVVIATAE